MSLVYCFRVIRKVEIFIVGAHHRSDLNLVIDGVYTPLFTRDPRQERLVERSHSHVTINIVAFLHAVGPCTPVIKLILQKK